jgi:phosphoribosylanthranilate isomerase
VVALDEMGVDLAGFIFYPKSPRYAGNRIAPEQLKRVRGRIIKVGVFVNSSFEELMRIVETYRLDMVQLHGDETPRYCEQVSNYISVIKAFRLSENDPVDWMVKPYDESCEMFMFDTFGAGYGGTGKKFDWNLLKSMQPGNPFFLSGGIEPGDEEQLKSIAQSDNGRKLFAVDINSRFEISPGVKDLEKVKAFVKNLKS